MTGRLWIDCDTGFDDLIAIGIAKQGPFRIVGISTVVGNTSLANTTRNTLAAVDLFGLQVPVYQGAAKPLAQEPQTIERLLGAEGMGTRGRKLPPPRSQVAAQDAISALCDALREPLTILATGPLTNLAMVLNLRPELAVNIERIVFMGGSATTGNHTAAAEFNTFADPEALDVLLRAGVMLEMFGLNLTRQVLIRGEHEDQLRALNTEKASILADHVGFYLRLVEKVAGKPMALHDPCAAAYLLWPQLFTMQDALVGVELHGTRTRGETVCELRVPAKGEPNVRLAVKAEGELVLAKVMEILTAEALR